MRVRRENKVQSLCVHAGRVCNLFRVRPACPGASKRGPCAGLGKPPILSCFEYVFTLFPHAAESGELGPAADGGWDGEGATGEVGEVWGGLGR
jgi:hypothetical protein